MKIIKCIEILHSSSEIGFEVKSGEIYYVLKNALILKDTFRFKIGKEYRILQYKISKSGETPRILLGHIYGATDWVIRGFMEPFIHHKDYYLKKIYLEEVKNAG